MFDEIHKKFEKKETDLCSLRSMGGYSRYLLVRSLDNDHIKSLLLQHDKVSQQNRAEKLYKELYASRISNAEIISFIKEEYPNVRARRLEQEEHLPSIIENFGIVKCGVRNDNLNDTVKTLVRDKTIASRDELEDRIDVLVSGTIKNYILWQYYNQATNDIIEHIFNDNAQVIPTLRKIKYVDFLIQHGEEIIPFDLKITHISDDFFDLYSKGLTYSEGRDGFSVGNNKSEIEKIKNFYKAHKANLSLPNYGGLKKTEIIEILENQENEEVSHFLSTIKLDRAALVEGLSNDLDQIEWWNYKFQGERLFKNNNRFFIFLAYKDSFEDARPLKGNLNLIRQRVNKAISETIEGNFNKINYYYQKDKGLEGAYTAFAKSMLVVGEASGE